MHRQKPTKTGNSTFKFQAYLVKLHGKVIDTVFFKCGASVYDVKQSLVEHDHYDPAIIVYMRTY